jgi:hypothetical protein
MNSAIHVRKLNLKFQSNLASIVVSLYTQFVMISVHRQNFGVETAVEGEKAKFIQNNKILLVKSIFHLVLCVIHRNSEGEKLLDFRSDIKQELF